MANPLSRIRRAGRTQGSGRGSSHRTAGFTLVELIVAGSISVIVVGAITISLSKIGRGREVAIRRLDAHLRATTALDSVRRNVASVMRSPDLFETRLLIVDAQASGRVGDFDRDELLVFANRLAPVRPGDKYQGEGNEYETQVRLMDDDLGAALWERRDPVPDRTPDGGGVAIPMVDGVVALQLEAYDGESWYPDWDSDLYGLPWAVRATVTAVGRKNGDTDFAGNDGVVTLRTTIAIDRVTPPPQETELSKEENAAVEEALTAEEEAAAGGGVGGGGVVGGGRPGDDGLGGSGAGGGRPGGGPGGPGGGFNGGGPPRSGGGPLQSGGSRGRGGRGMSAGQSRGGAS